CLSRWTLPSLRLRSSVVFQAEDGIRDRNVLEFRRVLFRSPDFSASIPTSSAFICPIGSPSSPAYRLHSVICTSAPSANFTRLFRSEERRVGTECTSTMSTGQAANGDRNGGHRRAAESGNGV